MMASSLSLLTRRLATVSLSSVPSLQNVSVKAFAASSQMMNHNNSLAVRHFAAGKVNKKKKNLERSRKGPSEGAKEDDDNLQHEEWVKFQQSIKIDGFETGQTTVLQKGSGKKRRGGKALRKRMEKKSLDEAVVETYTVGGGQYAPQRYSEEETERLLAEAYANIPKRDGKRGTRQLQRQSNRWHAVRKARKIAKKNYGIKQHTRRMERRSLVVKNVLQAKADAPATREREAAYQQHVLEQWTRVMFGGAEEEEKREGEP